MALGMSMRKQWYVKDVTWHMIIKMEINYKQDELNKILLVDLDLIFIAQGLQIENGQDIFLC